MRSRRLCIVLCSALQQSIEEALAMLTTSEPQTRPAACCLRFQQSIEEAFAMLMTHNTGMACLRPDLLEI